MTRQPKYLDRNSERIPRSLLRGQRANHRSIKIPYGESRQRRDCSLLQGNLQSARAATIKRRAVDGQRENDRQTL